MSLSRCHRWRVSSFDVSRERGGGVCLSWSEGSQHGGGCLSLYILYNVWRRCDRWRCLSLAVIVGDLSRAAGVIVGGCLDPDRWRGCHRWRCDRWRCLVSMSAEREGRRVSSFEMGRGLLPGSCHRWRFLTSRRRWRGGGELSTARQAAGSPNPAPAPPNEGGGGIWRATGPPGGGGSRCSVAAVLRRFERHRVLP